MQDPGQITRLACQTVTVAVTWCIACNAAEHVSDSVPDLVSRLSLPFIYFYWSRQQCHTYAGFHSFRCALFVSIVAATPKRKQTNCR